MSWFAELAGRAEDLLTSLDEQTSAALRTQNNPRILKRHDCQSLDRDLCNDANRKARPISQSFKNVNSLTNSPDRKETKKPAKTCKRNSPQKIPPQKLQNDDTGTYGYKPLRQNMAGDLKNCSQARVVARLQKVGLENAYLKNELNVTNKEVKEITDRLHQTEEGENFVDSSIAEELADTLTKLEVLDHDEMDRIMISRTFEQLNAQLAQVNNEARSLQEQNRNMDLEICKLRDKNFQLESLVAQFEEQAKNKDTLNNKLENELRHALSTINTLQSDFNKSAEECKRLETEWEAYKHRVKGMLAAKSNEIETLQQGVNRTEDTELLVEQIESLKKDRQELSDAMSKVRGECADMKRYVETLQNNQVSAEKVVVALRDAFHDERAARTKAEAQCNILAQEMKTIKTQHEQSMAHIKSVLHEKNEMLIKLQQKESQFSSTSSDSSALNVADFDSSSSSQITEENEKIHYLSHKLLQQQGSIEMLRADNNMLKIQLENLEEKHKAEQNARARAVSQNASRQRLRSNYDLSTSPLGCSRLVNLYLRSHPLFRLFIFIYMVCLHVWVITVLLDSSSDSYNKSYNQVFSPKS